MPKESAITFVHHYEINGVWAWPEWAHFRFGPFGEIHLGRPKPEDAIGARIEEFRAFLAALTLEDSLVGTDLERGMYILPVSTLEVVAVVAGDSEA